MNAHETQDHAFDVRADRQLQRLERMLASQDPDVIEVELAGDVLTITVKNRHHIVINRQRAARQIWMSAARQAWHFSEDPMMDRWVDKTGADFVSTLEQVLTQQLGARVSLQTSL